MFFSRDRRSGRAPVAVLLSAAAALSLSSCVAPPSGGQAQPPATVTVAPSPDSGSDSGDDGDSSKRSAPSKPKKKSGDSDADEAPGPQNCAADQLEVKSYPDGQAHGGGGGMDHAALRLSNIGRAPCKLHGFGRIATSGETAPIQAEHDPNQPVREFTLAPGEGVVKDLSWNRATATCTQPRELEVTAPGTRSAMPVAWHFSPVCDDSDTGRITLFHSAVHGGNDSNGIEIPGTSAGS